MFADEQRAENIISSFVFMFKLPYTLFVETKSLINLLNGLEKHGNDIYCLY